MNKLALVTGATSGIGRAFAERLARQGYGLVIVGRREGRLAEFASAHPETAVRTLAADLSTEEGVAAVATVCAAEPLTMLVNNAGLAHYMPLADLPADKARELVHVKTVAPTMLTRAAVVGMQARGEGAIINVSGMIAFSGPAASSVMPRRAVYAGGLAFVVAMSQTLSAELEGTGVRVQVLCPGVVATEFHERQGMDLSAVPRMSATMSSPPACAASNSARSSWHRVLKTPVCSTQSSPRTWPRSAGRARSWRAGTARTENELATDAPARGTDTDRLRAATTDDAWQVRDAVVI